MVSEYPAKNKIAGYAGVHDDENGGITQFGRTVRDAWVFGILPESETCAGWTPQRMEALSEKVYAAWEPYAHLPSKLPQELCEGYMRIHSQALVHARQKGWNPELGDDD